MIRHTVSIDKYALRHLYIIGVRKGWNPTFITLVDSIFRSHEEAVRSLEKLLEKRPCSEEFMIFDINHKRVASMCDPQTGKA